MHSLRVRPAALALTSAALPMKSFLSRLTQKPKAAFVRRLERGDVGRVVAVAFLQAQRIEHLVAADLNAEFLAGCHERIPDQLGTLRGDIQLPTQLANVADTLRPDVGAIDVDHAGVQVREALIRDIGRGDLLQDLAGLRSPQGEAGPIHA